MVGYTDKAKDDFCKHILIKKKRVTPMMSTLTPNATLNPITVAYY